MSLRNLERHARRLRDEAEELEAPRDLADRFGPFEDQPVEFVRQLLGARPEPYQEDFLAACVEEPRIVWRAAHGVGKTTTLSWILLWWLLSRPFSRVLVVAPAFERQVGRYLLPEVRRWLRRAPEELPVDVRANSVEVRGYARDWFALGVQASDPSKVEGAHAGSLCVLADEAKGLPADVVSALHGTQTDTSGDRLYVLASVPGGPSGPFYDAARSGVWRSFRTAAEDSSLVAPTWIEERRDEWGEASPIYISRVLAEFPEEGEGTLLKLADLEAAAGHELAAEPDEARPVAFGLDVARFGGDRTVLAVWRGGALDRLEVRQGLDTMEVAAWASSWIHRLKPEAVAVDEIGVGSGVVDRLRQLGHAGVVEGVNVGAAATRAALFVNRRAELAWGFREALERGEVSLPADETLLSELASLRYEYAATGKIKLESKDKTRRRVGRSPDLADAALLGFAAQAAGPVAEPILILGIGTVEDARAAGLLDGGHDRVVGLTLDRSPIELQVPPAHELVGAARSGRPVVLELAWEAARAVVRILRSGEGERASVVRWKIPVEALTESALDQLRDEAPELLARVMVGTDLVLVDGIRTRRLSQSGQKASVALEALVADLAKEAVATSDAKDGEG